LGEGLRRFEPEIVVEDVGEGVGNS